MQSKNAIIIGAGVAGMATATRLAAQGFGVKLYEKNTHPGGKLGVFEKAGYHFDTGPSLFTQPQNMEELFALAGEPIGNYFSYQKIDVACKYFFANGKTVQAYTNASQFAEELQSQVNEIPANVTRYLKHSEKLYEDIGTIFLNHSLHKRKTWLNGKIGKALSTVRFNYLLHTLHRYNKNNFSAPETVQLFDRFATYNGSDPYQSPAMFSMIPHLEQNEGTFYPRGGMISIANALFHLAKAKGVQFYFDTPVQRIIHHEGKVSGVVVKDENIHSDIIVSNADIYHTSKFLLNDQSRLKKILKQERSSSAVLFYWGIKRCFPQLQLHNIFFSTDYKKEFKGIFKSNELNNDPTIYINITAKSEPGMAPHGKENWFVMVNVPANCGQDWEQEKVKLRTAVLKKLNRMLGLDIEPLIETEDTMDPIMIEEQTASYMGSLYGTSSNSKLSAFLRHPNFTDTIKGLYFCGGSVHPGGGIPLCLKSAKIVSELIREENKKS